MLENSDALLGLLLAATVAVLSALSIAKPEIVSAVILALLALVLSLFFRTRLAIDRINAEARLRASSLDQISQQLDGQIGASKSFRLDYPDLSDVIEAADEILVIAGGSLRTSVGTYRYQFRTATERGATIRLCCPDPADDALMTQLAMKQQSTASSTKASIESNIDIAKRLSTTNPPEIRLLAQIPSTGMIHIRTRPGANTHEELLVKILPHSFDSGAAPVFRLDPLRDPIIYPVMLESAKATWNDGRIL
ncbi:MAG: hypothetical protein JWO56_2226 [Acidobacteria bacterium]|jgi:hypothetical protein|nr:hypothetical protein [Acidobacteriota bacterium]